MKYTLLLLSVLLFIKTNAQNKVGIGTNTPTEKLHIIGNVKADTIKPNAIKLIPNAGAGKVLVSDVNGNASWQTLSGGGGGSLDASYNYAGNGNGRTINAVYGAVEINGGDGLRVSGDLYSGNPLVGLNNKPDFFFLPKKAALRAGVTDSIHYSLDSIGYFSVGLGEKNKIKGNNSNAIGKNNYISGTNSSAIGLNNFISSSNGFAIGTNDSTTGFDNINIGFYNKNSGTENTTIGSYSTATGTYSFAGGYSSYAGGSYAIALGSFDSAMAEGSIAAGYINTTKGIYSSTLGKNNIANGYGGTVVGMYNDTVVAVQSFFSNQTPLFTVGNGNTDIERSNALIVRKDGRVGIGTNTPNEILDVNGDIETDTLKATNLVLTHNAGIGKVLTSDATGKANWQNPTDSDNQMLSSTSMGSVSISGGNTQTIKGTIASVGNGSGNILNAIPQLSTGVWELAPGYITVTLAANQRIVFTTLAILGKTTAAISPSSMMLDCGWANTLTPNTVNNTAGTGVVYARPSVSHANARNPVTFSGQFKSVTGGTYRIGFALRNFDATNVNFWDSNDYQNITYTIINE